MTISVTLRCLFTFLNYLFLQICSLSNENDYGKFHLRGIDLLKTVMSQTDEHDKNGLRTIIDNYA